MQTLIIIGIILVLAIFGMLFRVGKMVEVLKSKPGQRIDGANKINAFLFPLFLVVGLGLFFWYSNVAPDRYLPAAVSEHGQSIDDMFWITTYIITFVFVATHILLFTFPYIYQFKYNRKASFYPDNHKLELIWTVIPGIVLATLVFSGWKVWTDVTGPAPQESVVAEIVGKQFNWAVRYPGMDNNLGDHNFRLTDATNTVGIDFSDSSSLDDFMAQKIVIPVGKPFLLKIRSRDVLHSVFAIHFRQKMDAVPGMPTSMHFVPTKTTAEMRAELGKPDFDYEIACTEICGRGHFGMRAIIEVVEPEEFEKWKASQKAFLVSNPEYIDKIPAKMQDAARRMLPKEETASATPAPSVAPAAVPAPAASPAPSAPAAPVKATASL